MCINNNINYYASQDMYQTQKTHKRHHLGYFETCERVRLLYEQKNHNFDLKGT